MNSKARSFCEKSCGYKMLMTHFGDLCLEGAEYSKGTTGRETIYFCSGLICPKELIDILRQEKILPWRSARVVESLRRI